MTSKTHGFRSLLEEFIPRHYSTIDVVVWTLLRDDFFGHPKLNRILCRALAVDLRVRSHGRPIVTIGASFYNVKSHFLASVKIVSAT